MPTIYNISGFSQYEIIDRVMYRKAYKVKMVNGNWQYRQRRIIKQTSNNGIQGYMLVKDGQNKVKFFSCERLRHRLKKVSNDYK